MLTNLQWPLRTVIYNCKRLIIIPPQPFIWSRLVEVQDGVWYCRQGLRGGAPGGLTHRGEEEGRSTDRPPAPGLAALHILLHLNRAEGGGWRYPGSPAESCNCSKTHLLPRAHPHQSLWFLSLTLGPWWMKAILPLLRSVYDKSQGRASRPLDGCEVTASRAPFRTTGLLSSRVTGARLLRGTHRGLGQPLAHLQRQPQIPCGRTDLRRWCWASWLTRWPPDHAHLP